MKLTKTLGLAICLLAACGQGNSTSTADATSASASDAAASDAAAIDAAATIDASVSDPDAGDPPYSTAVTCGATTNATACPTGTWCVDTLPGAASGNTAVRGISVRSPTDIWVAQPTGTQSGSFHRFDGIGWRMCSPANTLLAFSMVLAIGENDALLGGSFGALFRFRNGQLTEIPFASSRTVQAIVPLGDDQFLVGYDGGNIVRTDGVTATLEVALAGALDIRDFMVFAPDDVWAIGEAGVAAHFDGSTWTLTTTGTNQYLQGIWGATTNDVWAIDFNGMLLRWSGTMWASTADVNCFSPRGLYGRAANDIYAVCGDNSGPMFHWNGTSWTPDNTAPAVAGVAIQGAGGYVGVVLTDGRILHRTD